MIWPLFGVKASLFCVTATEKPIYCAYLQVNIINMLKWTLNVIFKNKFTGGGYYILTTICFNPDVYTFCTSALLWAHSAKMASGGVSVASLWTEVNRCGQNGDFTRALKALTKSKNGYLLLSLSSGLKAAVKHPFLLTSVSEVHLLS